MKCWNAIRKHLASIVVVVTLIGVFGCGPLLMYEAFYGSDATVQLILQLFHVPISPNARLRFQSLHHAPATRHPFGEVNNSVAQEAAPFFGNLSVVTVDPAAPADMFFGLQRQSDCSLTRIDFTASVNNAQTAVTVTPGVQTPHYENTIHASAFSSSTPGVFPQGCADPALGISARPLVFGGIDASGALRVATIGTGGILTSSVKADGTFLTPATQATRPDADWPYRRGPEQGRNSRPGFDEYERARVVHHNLSWESGRNLSAGSESGTARQCDSLRSD